MIIALALGFTACQDDDFGFDGDANCVLTISATTKFSGVESRAVLTTDEEKSLTISNYVVLIYNSTDRNATLGKVVESATLPINATVLVKGVSKYMAIMIANTTATDLAGMGVTVGSSIDALYGATFDINSTYNNPKSASNFKFTWSGSAEFDYKTNKALNIILNPNVAKMTVTINNTSTGAESTDLLKVQVKNVASKVRFAQNALSDAGLFTSADNGNSPSVINYPVEEIEVPAGSSGKTYSWYVPHNELEETSGSGSRAERANAKATYVEVSGIRSLDYLTNAYKIYPGIAEAGKEYADMANYYVKADYQYNLTVNITDDGLTYSVDNKAVVSDNGGNTTPLNVVKFPAGSNCYMVHPKATNVNGNTIYEIPIDQVNRYWKDIKNNGSHAINETTRWKPIHLWQDMEPQAIYFCDENGDDITTKTTSTPYEYLSNKWLVGNQPIRFRLKNNNTYGNVVIGIVVEGTDGVRLSGFAWSWHLWITDYNPDAAARSEVNKYFLRENYNNPLERNGWYYENNKNGIQYKSGVHHYSHVRSAYKSYNTEWETGGLYEDCWIMDRNLGALMPNNYDAKEPFEGFGLYYQYGRKDPIPFYNANLGRKMYDMIPNDGVSAYGSTPFNISGTVKIDNTVKFPNAFYGNASGTWATDANENPWYHLPTTEKPSKGQKTIFDPCPPGWCLPIYDAFKIAEVSKNYIKNGVYYGRTASASELEVDRASFALCWDSNESGNATEGYGVKQRFMAILALPVKKDNGEYDMIEAFFPMQDTIAPTANLIDRNNPHPLKLQLNLQTNECVYLWTADAADSNTKGTCCELNSVDDGFPSYLVPTNNDLYSIQSSNSGRWNVKYYGKWSKVSHYASVAMPVRCIQEPKN